MTPARTRHVPSLRSMTGFGRAEVSAGPIAITVEARSLNHRHLDVTFRLPRALAGLEMDARRVVQARLERGHVEIAVQLSPAAGASGQQVSVDQALAAEYLALARQLGAAIGVYGEVTLAWVLERPGVVRLEEADAPTPDTAWPVLSDALSRVPSAVTRREERLRERIRALLGEASIDEGRILGEVAIWADKTDVREELTRLRAHLEQFASVLDKGGAVGRPLDFLIQELNREVNTIASKADDLEVSQAALAAKGLIEKMREQVQNLE